MNCPRCSTQLSMSNKHGVEIDFCPSCRGIWLDRGELEKIMEREFAMESQNNRFDDDDDDDDDHKFQKHDEHKYQNHSDSHNYKNRKRGFWANLLDFD